MNFAMRHFELFVARRYLRARRKQAVISVVTAISVLGVAAGVMALIIALAINNGFRGTLQRSLLGATAHINILEKQPGNGIENWPELDRKLARLRHVVDVAPTLYSKVFLTGPVQSAEATVKGIVPRSGGQVAGMLRNLKQGSIEGLKSKDRFPGIILGSRLAENIGAVNGNIITLMSPQGDVTPFGVKPSYFRFRVVGIFESGFFDLDSTWAFASLETMQRVMSVDNAINSVELKLDDIDQAPAVAEACRPVIGPKLDAITWMEQNRPLLNAFRMERAVTIVTIGLIELVAGLNILITLVMMVMEKYRDIAILVSMGAKFEQIRKIFVLQGLLIGIVGAIIGLILGYGLSSLADHYRWIRLDEQVYALSYVPFEPRWLDGLWVAAAAIFVSFVATLYPARNAARIAPVEALRYE